MASNENDAKILVCAPYRHHTEVSRYPTNVMIRRASCGHLVWVAEAGQSVWDNAYPICEPCYEASVFPSDIKHGAAPGAFEEIERMVGRDQADKARAAFRARFGRNDDA